MKRIVILLLLALASVALQAAEEKPEYNTVREYRNKVFELQHRTPRDLMPSIHLLGSGFQGSAINTNNDLRTITVRDFPENIAAIEEAIRRLDRPAPATPDIELRISVLIASKSSMGAAPVPDELAPVLEQLRSTLRYSHYGLMNTTVHRTTLGHGIEGSGVADAALLGMTVNQERPVVYRYNLREISASKGSERAAIDIDSFDFSMNVPINLGKEIQYQPVGFRTPVSIRANEKVVIGTTTMGDKALIVVVTAATQ